MTMPTLTLTDAPTPAMRSAIVGPLVRFNEKRAGQPENYLPLAVLVAEPDKADVIGGLWGGTSLTHLRVDLLFVPEALRGSGIGTEMMRQAEAEAVRRGCRGAWLDTFSFQARGFYERLGYTVFGTIENYLPGHDRHFLKKVLSQ